MLAAVPACTPPPVFHVLDQNNASCCTWLYPPVFHVLNQYTVGLAAVPACTCMDHPFRTLSPLPI
jgi:hypothetical protein